MVYIDDLVDALILAQKVQGTFNIGTGQETKIKEVYSLVKEAMKSNASETISEQEPYSLIADNEAAKSKLGWMPKVKVKEGIERTVKTFLTSSRK